MADPIVHASPPPEKTNERHDVMIPAKLHPRFGPFSFLACKTVIPRIQGRSGRCLVALVDTNFVPRDEATERQRAKACDYKAWLRLPIAWA